jgi:hypothetical protein
MSLIVVSHMHEEPRVWCYVCGTGFGASKMGRQFEEHVALCANRSDEELRGESLRVKNPHLFDPNVSGDVEFQRWVRANREAIIDGRLRM